MTSVSVLIELYLDGLATDEQRRELEQYICADKQVAEAVFKKVFMQRCLYEHYRRQDLSHVLPTIDEINDDRDLDAFVTSWEGDPKRKELLTEIFEQEAAARERDEKLRAAEKEQQRKEDRERAERWARMLPSYEVSQSRRHYIVIPRPVAYGAIAAVIAMTLLVLWPLLSQDESIPDPVQVVTEAETFVLASEVGAQWADNRRLPTRAGESFAYDELYFLRRGFVELVNPAGTRVIVESPANFSLASASLFKLDSGIVSVHVPEADHGFTVNTPAGDVVDLGTEFAVDARDVDDLKVYVRQGSVRVTSSHPQAVPSELVAGDAIRMTSAAPDVEPVLPHIEQFAWALPANEYLPPRTGETVRYLFSPPESLRYGHLADADTIFVIPEGRGVVVPHEITVNIHEPGFYNTFDSSDHVLQPGTVVDSYLVHYDSSGPRGQITEQVGSLTFDRPILGLIVGGRMLTETDELFGLPQIIYPRGVRRGLEGTTHQGEESDRDTVFLSDDQRRIRFHLQVGRHADQIRILVESRNEADKGSLP